MAPRDNESPERNAHARQGFEPQRAEVLRIAIRHVESVGLSLGVASPLFETFAAEAGVSKSKFAQIWQTTKAFYTDLFCELANQAQIDRANTETLLSTWSYLSTRIDDLHTSEGRRRILIDVIRTAAEYNFEAVTNSNKWKTYAALSTTITSWPEGEDRTQVLDALRASEFAFIETMDSFYRNVLPTIGYGLRPMFNGDYQPFTVAAASVIEGLGIVRSTVPALVEAHFTLPAGDSEEVWSVAALAFMGVVDAFIEPDPNFNLEEAISRLSTGVDVSPPSRSE